jgi:hypothetical protein
MMTVPDGLLDQIAAIRDEYGKLRTEALTQLEFCAAQGDSKEASHHSTEAERYGMALHASTRILKLATAYKPASGT